MKDANGFSGRKTFSPRERGPRGVRPSGDRYSSKGRPAGGLLDMAFHRLLPAEQAVIRFEINEAIRDLLGQRRTVVLEHFGIVSTTESRFQEAVEEDGMIRVAKGTRITPIFEKCADVTGAFEQDAQRAAETKELANTILARLPAPLKARWSAQDVKRLVASFSKQVRNQVVEKGYSEDLRVVGSFYALHNRQGDSVSDWYGGADIFLDPGKPLKEIVEFEQRFPPPAIESTVELFSAAYGAPVSAVNIPLHSTLNGLGFGDRALAQFGIPDIELSVHAFWAPPQDGKSARWVLVSDGLRRFQPASRQHAEISIQYPAPGTRDVNSLEGWQFSLFACGVLLLLGDDDYPAESNTCLSLHRPIDSVGGSNLKAFERFPLPSSTGRTPTSKLDALLLTKLHGSAPVLRAPEPFTIFNLLGITAQEADLAARLGKKHVMSLLRSRGADQITNSRRPCLLSRSVFVIGGQVIGGHAAAAKSLKSAPRALDEDGAVGSLST